ncbi:MAG TPA: FHA domain-containing protein, partial [bacterium]|nr:FHA domain-containing protein [bacterium]
MPPTLTLGTQSWPLERGETTIGRQETCDIVIKDTSLSRAHATIHVAKDTVEVVDNNSSNGTYINGVRMAAGPLKNGDKLKLGSILFDFTWPESVVKVNVSPISQEQAQKLKESLTTQKQVAVDWKVPLMTTAGLGAFVTGVAAGLFGAMMGAGAGMVIAMAVGAVGAIATALMIRSLSAQRVQTPLRAFKDDLDLFFSGQKPDLEVIQGFPELNDSIHSVRLGSEILKERVANIYKLQLHEAQMAAQLHQAARDESGQRGFGAPMLGLDEQFRLQAWTPEA